jgi:hypothetical protein
MKISELIKDLQRAMAEHGNADVYSDEVLIERVTPVYPWKEGEVFVVDKEAGVSFFSLE